MKQLQLIERARILAAHQRDLDLTAGKNVSKMLNDLCDHILGLYQESERPWVGLTDQEIGACIAEVDATSHYGHHHFGWHLQFARSTECKLKEKNT